MNITERNNVTTIGHGARTLLFAHGFGCDQHTWKLVIPAFSEEYKIVLFDYVGAGNSDNSAYEAQRYSHLSGYAQDIIDICEELQLEDVIFIGHCVSSMIGVLAANKAPGFFKKLIFIGPSPRYINDSGYFGGMERADLEGLLEVMDSNYLGWSSTIAPAMVGNPDRPQLGEDLSKSYSATDPHIAKQFARVIFMSDSRNDLPLVQIPSLTIQGREDILTSERVANYIREHTPGNEILMLESSGHCPHLSDPEAIIKAINDFIK